MEMASVFVSECCDRVTRDVHIVLDDYHEAAETSGLNLAIDYMLANLPRSVHIAVLSRYDPGFSLSKVKLADGVAHVGVELLRFDAAQAAAVVESLTGRRPKRGHIARLVASYRGLARKHRAGGAHYASTGSWHTRDGPGRPTSQAGHLLVLGRAGVSRRG